MRLSNLLEAKERSVLSVLGRYAHEVDSCNVSYSNLDSFEGGPKIVTGELNIIHNKFESFDQYAPIKVGTLRAQHNHFSTLENIPSAGYSIFIHDNQLISLKGAPAKVDGDFDISSNELDTLEHCPKEVAGDFNCSYNKLENLNDAPAIIVDLFNCSYNKITSLQGIHKQIKRIDGVANFTYNKIRSHMLGLMKIKGLKGLIHGIAEERRDHHALRIIDKHLKGDRDVLACQDELIDAGLDEFAQL
jgi:hypothetical protein